MSENTRVKTILLLAANPRQTSQLRLDTVKLWNLSAQELTTLKGHSSSVLSVVFSPDGKTIATGSSDNTVKLWNLDLDDLLARGCAWAHDYLKNNRNVKDEDRKLCDDVDSRR